MADSEELQHASRARAGLGLGERLRSARKARALSVTQVAEALHLEEPMVLALEEERFDAMGAPVFVRGHLKRYAQLVGLAPEAVLEAYRAAVPDSVAPPSLARARVEPERVRIGAWVFWLIGAVVVVGLLIALGGGSEERAGTPVPAADAPPDAATGLAPAPSPEGESQATPPAAPAEAAGMPQEGPAAPAAAPAPPGSAE